MKRILIANRGEIACRIIRTCKRLGIETVALASTADIHSLHVKEADYVAIVGGPQAKDSYLNIPKIVELALSYDVDGVHPGYGFLSENPEFAQALLDAGIPFIGPNVKAIQMMGSKSQAKALAEGAGVPIIPGYRGEHQSNETLLKEAERIGFPLLIKATYGGGGKGMRRVDTLLAFKEALGACQREALSAFGNDEVMLEKYVDRPRHIEVQVFADTFGNMVTLAERDCSLQRRHQKIIEEAPGFNLSETLRQKLSDAALKMARSVEYVGAGTVEFLVDDQENYYFLEMNTRLQVEHPVTEMILGYDLVEWQIRIARGESLPVSQEKVFPHGHAIEVRLYAEDPENNFLPSIGCVEQFRVPTHPHIRLDTGIEEGNNVSIFYDPMIAKLIVWAENRDAALSCMIQTLHETTIKGVTTNIHFLKKLLLMPPIKNAWVDVGFIDRYMTDAMERPVPYDILAFAALWLANQREKVSSYPWQEGDDWRMCGLSKTMITLIADSQPYTICLAKDNQKWVVSLGDFQEIYEIVQVTSQGIRILHGDKIMFIHCQRYEEKIWICDNHHLYNLQVVDSKHVHGLGHEHQGNLSAPMPGRVISVLATDGQEVDMGTPLLILEAMKMEHTIRSPYKGVVEKVFFHSGDFVEEGVELAKVRAA